MNPQVRHFFSSPLFPPILMMCVLLISGWVFFWCHVQTHRDTSHHVSTSLSQPAPNPISSAPSRVLSSFQGSLQAAPSQNQPGELSRRFRLAGIIFGISNNGADEPIAILDDRLTVTQSIVTRSQEIIPGVSLLQVHPSSIILAGPNGHEELFLEKATPSAPNPSLTAAPNAASSATTPAQNFGGREVFPGRWEFSRDALLDYYAELRNEPERLLTIFDSMDPVYVEDPNTHQRSIEGYVVGVEGEPDFFSAAGLQNGDIVRSVNSLKMTNRRRAESFIKNFVEGSVSMFVLEVERNGKTTKHVYQIH